MELPTGHHVVGWGYQGKSTVDLIDEATRRSASTVVDIRLNPVSRKPGFSKRRLMEALDEASIGYLHLPALGNPRDNRAGFADQTGTEGKMARERFRDEVLGNKTGTDALRRVAEIAESGSVILLCFEDDEQCCHRSLVLDALAGATPAATIV